MTSLENLHYAIGKLAFAVARADGSVQKEEEKIFHDIVESELRRKDYEFNISAIIFQIMNMDKSDSDTAYKSALEEIKLNSHYLSPELKNKFINVMEKVAKAFPPITISEHSLIEKFKKDISPIKGDPVYYEKV